MMYTFDLTAISKKTLFRFDKTTAIAPRTASATSSAAEAAAGCDAGDSASAAGVADSSPTATSKEHRRNVSDTSNDLHLLASATASAGTGSPARRSTAAGGAAQLVCAPDAALLRIVYVPLIGYVQEIEQLLKLKPGAPCALHAFVTAHVRDAFLAKGHRRTLELTVDGLTKNADAWRTAVSADEAKALGLQRPLLQSTVLFERREYMAAASAIWLTLIVPPIRPALQASPKPSS